MLTLEELGEKPMEHLYSLCDFFPFLFAFFFSEFLTTKVGICIQY